MIEFYKRNFRFHASRYEEWQGGSCISNGPISCEIVAEVSNEVINFRLMNMTGLRIKESFGFSIFGEEADILHDRIQYVHSSSDFNPIVPFVCNLFIMNGTINCVRFAMTNPDRIIEFYGRVIELDQIENSQVKNSQSPESAEEILSELKSYNGLTKDAIMERAINLYNKHAGIRGINDAKCIIESLKLFIRCNKLEVEDEKSMEFVSMSKPKILMYIALCNYKINNINQAYQVARKALDSIAEVENNSPFSGIPRSIYGEDKLRELLDFIEENYPDEFDRGCDYKKINENKIDTSIFETLCQKAGFDNTISKANLKRLIDAISSIQEKIPETGNSANANDDMMVFHIYEMFEMYKNALYFAWEKYKYGWHSDFWKEGDSMASYILFVVKAKEIIPILIKLLRTDSPFRQLEKNGKITTDLIEIFEDLKNMIDN